MLAILALACAPAYAASPAITPTPAYQPEVVNPELVGGRRIDTGTAATFLVWGSDATILRSADGREWQHAQTPGSSDLAQLAANPQASVLVAVGNKGSILRSTDAGKTWRAARNTIDDTDLLAVVHVYERIWVAAGTQGRILRSTDDARTWTLVNSHLKAAMRTLSLDAYSGRILIGGDDGLVGFSIDAGVSWQLTALTMPDPTTPISGFYRFGRLLLATSALAQVQASTDPHAVAVTAAFADQQSAAFGAALEGYDSPRRADVLEVMGLVLDGNLRAWQLGRQPVAEVHRAIDRAAALIFDR
jgi:photosystem II stability/assembly factor-like uncharacterized protein